MQPIILTAASIGNKWTRDDSPYLPFTAQEIINDGVAAYKAGASMLHIHTRKEDGSPNFDPAGFVPVLDAYRKQCPDVILQMSTGGIDGKAAVLLEPMLALCPHLASLNLRGTKEEILFIVKKFNEYHVIPVIECYSLNMLRSTHALLAEGVLKAPVVLEVLFPLIDDGKDFAQLASELLEFQRWIPKGAIWSQTRGGSSHVRLQALSAALGGHLRTGLEDCISYKPGEMAKSSAELIAQAAEIAIKMGRSIATPMEARAILGVA